MDIGDIERSLEDLLIEDRDFLSLEKEMSQYCPFEALGMVRSEVRHGNYLADLMSPNRPHGFHDEILRAFLRAVADNCQEGIKDLAFRSLDVHLVDLEGADVRREWRSIDLLVVLNSVKLVIAIELKIESSQSREQLKKYRDIVEREWPKAAGPSNRNGWRHIFVFLTKYEELPLDAPYWVPLRLAQLIRYLEEVSKNSHNASAVSMMESYVRMLRRHHLDDERLEELAMKLWSRHESALNFLMDHRPDRLSNIFELMLERKADFLTAMAGHRLTVEGDEDDNGRIMRFAFKDWDELPDFRRSAWTSTGRFILMELKKERQTVNAYVYFGPASPDDASIAARCKFAEVLKTNRMHRSYAVFGREYACLAKKTLEVTADASEMDVAAIVDEAIRLQASFALEVYQHFNPILAALRV